MIVYRPGNCSLIHGPVESWSPMAWTRSLATKRSSSSGLRVARTFHNACARSAEPPQMTTQTGRGSGRSTTRMIHSDASVSLPSPTLSATGTFGPATGCPALMPPRRLSAGG